MLKYAQLNLAVPVSEALDPGLWRSRFAFGLLAGQPPPNEQKLAADLAAVRGIASPTASPVLTGISDDAIRWHLRAALSELEMKLGVPFGFEVVKGDPVDPGLVQGRDYDRVEPRRPYLTSQILNWYRLDILGPVLSVERVRAFFFGNLVFEVRVDSTTGSIIQIEHAKHGTIHVLPITTAAALILPTGWYGSAGLLFLNARTPIPGVWSVDYTRGPVSEDGQPGKIECVLVNWVYATAARSLLAIDSAGRLKGVSSTSLSMDGVSRSISLQPSIYKALEDYLEKLEERIDWKRLAGTKRGLRVVPYGY